MANTITAVLRMEVSDSFYPEHRHCMFLILYYDFVSCGLLALPVRYRK